MPAPHQYQPSAKWTQAQTNATPPTREGQKVRASRYGSLTTLGVTDAMTAFKLALLVRPGGERVSSAPQTRRPAVASTSLVSPSRQRQLNRNVSQLKLVRKPAADPSRERREAI